MAKSKWYRQSRRSMVRGLLLIGSGAFLLGAGVSVGGGIIEWIVSDTTGTASRH
jgi:hypothetical protein